MPPQAIRPDLWDVWDTQPALALVASYVIPILLLPIVLFVLRRHAAR
jgi:hypothetical protein